MTRLVSPEAFASIYTDKSYEELLSVRKELLDKIYEYENSEPGGESKGFEMLGITADTIYYYDLKYLVEICRLISEKYQRRG